MDSQHQLLLAGSPSSIAQLGQAIKNNAHKIESHLAKSNAKFPTFEFGSTPRLDLPPDLENARQNLLDDMEHLTALLRGPLGHVLTHSNPVTFSYNIVLAAISRFHIAEHVPLDGAPISIAALATACHMEQSDLIPLLRAAIANRTFEAVGDFDIKHNAASFAIASIPDLRYWLEYSREDFTPSAFALPEAIDKWPGASEPQCAAFALLTPDHLPMFDAIKNDPARAERFAGSMRLLGRAGAAELPRVAEALQLDSLPQRSTIVDIGGSMGEVMTHILRRFEQLHGVVQDLPSVIAGAQVPPDLADRFTFQDADFFSEQPRKGAAVYFLRKVLHDWSDEYARRILQGLVPALTAGAKVILNEMCLPSPGTVHPRREQNQRGWDLAMKWLLNGKERDQSEWKALFASVDSRFEFVGVRAVPAATSSLIEFNWMPQADSART